MLHLHKRNDQFFLKCSCGFPHRTGIPCPHFFYLVDEVQLLMVHIKYWKVYHAHYGRASDLGRALVRGQGEWHANEGMGVPVSNEMAEKLQGSSDATRYPIAMKKTTKTDQEDAAYVLRCSPCLHQDLQKSKAMDTLVDDETCTLNHLGTLSVQYEGEVSEEAKRMQNLVISEKNRAELMTSDQIDESRKTCVEAVDSVLNSNRHSVAEKAEFVKGVVDLKRRAYAAVPISRR